MNMFSHPPVCVCEHVSVVRYMHETSGVMKRPHVSDPPEARVSGSYELLHVGVED